MTGPRYGVPVPQSDGTELTTWMCGCEYTTGPATRVILAIRYCDRHRRT